MYQIFTAKGCLLAYKLAVSMFVVFGVFKEDIRFIL
jgi:hypothetical protein